MAVAVLLQLVAGVVGALTISAPTAQAAAIAPPAPPPPPPAPVAVPVPGEADAADAAGPVVPLFQSAAAPQPSGELKNPTFEGVPLVFAVLEDQGAWLHVRINVRPNGATAWIRRSDVSMRHISNRIVVELGARKLQVLHGNDVLAEHPVAIGAPSGPTPVGEFYVDATVHITRPDSPYGVGQLSVSGFSEVYKSFGGGIGQIAIHGTNNPRSIGGNASHGCVRMLNDAWNQVAALAPNGTPVSIRP